MTIGLVAAAAMTVGLSACSAQVPVALEAIGSEASVPVVPATTRTVTDPPATTVTPSTASSTTTNSSPVVAPTTTSTVVATSTVPTTSTTLVSASTTLAAAPESFGDGTHMVGADIQAGRYEALEPGDGCSWQRLSGLSGEYRDVLADGNPQHRTIMDVLVDDVAVVTTGCGTWTGFRPFDEPLTEFGPGIWAIGEQILPGMYSAPGGAGCFWATVTGFDGSQTSISAIARPESGPVLVTLTTDNMGIVSDNCGNFSQTG